jgi:hypothetical protein
MKKRKHKKQRKQHTPLAKHAREGKTLIPPLNQLNTAPLDWQRDFLPEHLWISALAVKFGLDQMSKPFHALADAIDTAWPASESAPFIGLVTDFGLVPEAVRRSRSGSPGMRAGISGSVASRARPAPRGATSTTAGDA